MDTFSKIFATGLFVWLGLLTLLVTIRMLTGKIHVAGLLSHRLNADGGKVLPERVLAMAVFPWVLGLYALDALHADVSGTTGPPSLPDVPEYLLSLLTGSNGLYLAGKIARTA
jgi:hypothetical protein